MWSTGVPSMGLLVLWKILTVPVVKEVPVQPLGSWLPIIRKLLGSLRTCPKQSSSQYMQSLLAMSAAGLIRLALLCGNALNTAAEAPSSQDDTPAPAAEHIAVLWSWALGAAEEVWVSGVHCAQITAHSALGWGLRAGTSPGGTWNLGPDT